MRASWKICLSVTTFMLAASCAPGGGAESDDEEEMTSRQLKLPLTISGPCEAGLDYAGRCDGDLLVWCEGEQQHEAACGDNGQSCDWQNDAIGYNCVSSSDSSIGSGCGDVDYAGYCDAERLVWCEDGALQDRDCAASGRSCAWQDDSIGYNCLGSASGGAGLLTITGIVGGDYYVSQDYGYSDFDGGYWYCQSYGDFGGNNVHCGADIAIPYGTPLYIPGDATVLHDGGTGYFEDETNPAAGELKIGLANGAEVILGHMSQIAVAAGQSVGKGQYAGLSGTANGGHVHIEVRIPSDATSSGMATVDPVQYFGP